MGIGASLRDFIWSGYEARGKDPFANRSKSLWQTVADLDALENVNQEGFNVPQVFTACRIYGNAMASLDFATFKGNDGKDVEVEGHWLTKLLMDHVNSYMIPADWFVTKMFHWGVRGNAMSYIVRNGRGRPVELIPLNPDDLVKAEIINGEKRFTFTDTRNKPRVIPDRDIFHIAGPGWDGVLGKNPIEAHRDMMDTSKLMNLYARKFFENGAHLKHVIEAEGIVDDDEYNRFIGTWKEAFSGAHNTGKTAFLENGWKLKPVSLNPVDAAYLQISGNVTKMVANIYGLPLYLFNEFKEGAQYDNVESQDLAVVKYAIGPMVVKWEQEIKRKLLPKDSKFFGRFDLFSLSRGDMKSISEYANRFFIIGSLNQDEIRRKYLKMNPLPDGQGSRYYVQGNNMVPIDKIDQIYDQKLQGNAIPGEGGKPPDKQADTDLPSIKEE